MTDPNADLAHSARALFAAKLAHEIDPADLAAARAAGNPPIVVDTRSGAAWDQGHLPGSRSSARRDETGARSTT